MSKVYKLKNSKLVVYLPYDVIEAMSIKDGDDIDFLKYGEGIYLIAKKMDIVKMLSKASSNPDEAPKPSPKSYVQKGEPIKAPSLEPKELELLKKIDTLKYNDRTNLNVASILNNEEKATLQALLKRKIIVPFSKGSEKEVKYSIQKSVYDAFLYRKKRGEQTQSEPVKMRIQQNVRTSAPVQQKSWERKIAESGSEAYIELLESKGFLVLGNEAEASIVSTALEDSIRQGLVVGTRAFNKKFYIGLRGFINKNAPKILKAIEQKSTNIDDIVKETGVEEDGVRTVLYFLSESGDVTEVRKDIFRAA